jgi:hypothetical protein
MRRQRALQLPKHHPNYSPDRTVSMSVRTDRRPHAPVLSKGPRLLCVGGMVNWAGSAHRVLGAYSCQLVTSALARFAVVTRLSRVVGVVAHLNADQRIERVLALVGCRKNSRQFRDFSPLAELFCDAHTPRRRAMATLLVPGNLAPARRTGYRNTRSARRGT